MYSYHAAMKCPFTSQKMIMTMFFLKKYKSKLFDLLVSELPELKMFLICFYTFFTFLYFLHIFYWQIFDTLIKNKTLQKCRQTNQVYVFLRFAASATVKNILQELRISDVTELQLSVIHNLQNNSTKEMYHWKTKTRKYWTLDLWSFFIICMCHVH